MQMYSLALIPWLKQRAYSMHGMRTANTLQDISITKGLA
jgi:hypothetical protein